MIKTINFQDFCDHFNKFSEGYRDKFSYNGKRALFDYLESLEEDTDTKIELDVIALCCEYTEYANISEVYDDYSQQENSEELSDAQMLEWLQDRTQVIEFDGGIIIQNF